MKSGTIKTPAEIELMRIGGKILANTLELVCQNAKPGVSTKTLDEIAEKYILSQNALPSFKGFNGFPASICSAIDEIVVHGIPSQNQILKEGDLFTVDCGVNYKGFHTDAARTIAIGKITNEKSNLIVAVEKAFNEAVKIIKSGIEVAEIGKRIEEVVEKEYQFCIIYDLTGHGIGKNLHEAPHILNYWDGKKSPKLKTGMTIAIEPIIAVSTHETKTLKDNWTIVTDDNSPSAQYENTVLVTENGCEVLTKK